MFEEIGSRWNMVEWGTETEILQRLSLQISAAWRFCLRNHSVFDGTMSISRKRVPEKERARGEGRNGEDRCKSQPCSNYLFAQSDYGHPCTLADVALLRRACRHAVTWSIITCTHLVPWTKWNDVPHRVLITRVLAHVPTRGVYRGFTKPQIPVQVGWVLRYKGRDWGLEPVILAHRVINTFNTRGDRQSLTRKC